MIEAGLDVARINFSHGDEADHHVAVAGGVVHRRERVGERHGPGVERAGARVEAEHGQNRSATTSSDEEGAFALGRLSPGTVTLMARGSGYASSTPVTITLAADGMREGVVLNLRPGAVISGEVQSTTISRVTGTLTPPSPSSASM